MIGSGGWQTEGTEIAEVDSSVERGTEIKISLKSVRGTWNLVGQDSILVIEDWETSVE